MSKTLQELTQQIDELSVGTLNTYAAKASAKRTKLNHIKQVAPPAVAAKSDALKGNIAKAQAKAAIKTISKGPAPSVKEELEQIDELSNDKLTAYKKAAAAKPLAKDGDQTAGGILRNAQKRVKGVQMANKKLGEHANETTIEPIEERALDKLKALVGKDTASIAKKRSAEFAARKRARDAEAAAKSKAPAKPSGSDPWSHVEYKKGTSVREDVEQVEEAAVKIPAHDEIAGNLPTAPSGAETIKLATKGQLKMLATAAKAKYVSHTNVEVPGTQVKEEAVKPEGTVLVPPAIPTQKGKNPTGNGAGKAAPAEPMKKLAKEEVEQIEELSVKTLKSYGDKAKAQIDDKSNKGTVLRAKRLTGSFQALVKRMDKSAKGQHEEVEIDTDVEQIEELSNDKLTAYKKAAGADASAADKSGNFDRGNKRFSGIVKATKKQFANDAKRTVKENMISFKDYLKIMTEEFEVESEELAEEFISHSDFESKVQNHKSHGMVVHHDYDHKAKKAIIRHVDHDGEVREFHYHEKGTTVQRLAPKRGMGKPSAATAPEKRGRGRPAGSKNRGSAT